MAENSPGSASGRSGGPSGRSQRAGGYGRSSAGGPGQRRTGQGAAGGSARAGTRAGRALSSAGLGRRIAALPPAPVPDHCQLPAKLALRAVTPTRGYTVFPACGRRTEGRYQHGSGPQHEDVRRRPTLPRGPPRSTIGAEGLNFRVRNGTGCFPFAMATETLWRCQERAQLRRPGTRRPTASREPHSGRETRSISRSQAARPISTGQLHTSPCFHLRPINPVV